VQHGNPESITADPFMATQTHCFGLVGGAFHEKEDIISFEIFVDWLFCFWGCDDPGLDKNKRKRF